MEKLIVIFAVLAAASASDLNLNEMCRGILFATLPHPTDNNLFIGCVQGKGTLLGCSGQDEVFDPFLVSCVSGDTVTNPDHEKLCENIVFGWFPYEDDCERYIVCEFSRPHVRQCPENSIFNRFLPGCVAGDSETCTFEHHTTPEPTTTTPTPEPCLITCRINEILDIENCQCYCPITECPIGENLENCQCVPAPITTTPEPTSTPEPCLITCRINEIADIENCQCYCPITECPIGENLENCQCVPMPTPEEPTTLPTTTIRTTTPRGGNDVNISFVCPISGDGNIPHQTNCARFFECIQGIRYPRNCPAGEIFDVISKRCNDPENSLCAANIRCV